MATQRNQQAPEFGKWEGDVLYTAYFEKTTRKVKAGGSDNKPVELDPPLSASRAHASSRTHATREPTVVRQRHQDAPKATTGEYPAKPEPQTRPEIFGQPRRMVTNQSHPHRDTGYQGVGTGTAGVEYRTQSNPTRPRVGGGMPQHLPLRDRNNYSESGFGAGSIPPPAPGRSRPAPFPEGERTPIHRAKVPRFGEWNVNSPSTDYGFTQVFGQLRDQKKTAASSTTATEAPQTRSYSSENMDIEGRPKKRWWPLWCSSW